MLILSISRTLRTLLRIISFVLFLYTSFAGVLAQEKPPRTLRYHPEGTDFVIINGLEKFNRALYGTNTAFRIETGDRPEFGLFMPDMGGNVQLGIMVNERSLWLQDAAWIKSVYRPGTRLYELKDPLWSNAIIDVQVLALADAEGVIVKVSGKGLPAGTKLVVRYGGASNKRFSRNGDLGVDDPRSFDLKAVACEGNSYVLNGLHFNMRYAQHAKNGPREVTGVFSKGFSLSLARVDTAAPPQEALNMPVNTQRPVLLASTSLSPAAAYLAIKVKDEHTYTPEALPALFGKAERKRKEIAATMQIATPDKFINPLGGVLSVAADGIWDDKTGWQHGAIGWRMPLTGWRAAYIGDVLGWHTRARHHFDGFAASQIRHVPPVLAHPAQDTALRLARAEKKWGTQMYSNGYITRNPRDTTKMHHYDMNLVFIDELLWHFNWTGDWDYVRKMWPVLKAHLAWEKRNFDPDNDGLYDAYASIWASDALQYSGGAVTHSSAYNYRANKMAAMIAEGLGEDASVFKQEAAKILNALNKRLWLRNAGHWAEYQDLLGNKLIHPSAAVWSIYHAIDSEVGDIFQNYQAGQYMLHNIPRIPVRASGLADTSLYTLATTNWMPYAWSVNNVAFAEVAHSSLALFQAGLYEDAFSLFKAAVTDGMYLGKSPGNIGQISYYDAARGECYRDFGDPVGVYGRVLVEGLFGIRPDGLNRRLLIKPGFPASWEHAAIRTSDISLVFQRQGATDRYSIEGSMTADRATEMVVPACGMGLERVTFNGKSVRWKYTEGIGRPYVSVQLARGGRGTLVLQWTKEPFAQVHNGHELVSGDSLHIDAKGRISDVYDPQGVVSSSLPDKPGTYLIEATPGRHTFFVKVSRADMTWWTPVNISIVPRFDARFTRNNDGLMIHLHARGQRNLQAAAELNPGNAHVSRPVIFTGATRDTTLQFPADAMMPGLNILSLSDNGRIQQSIRLEDTSKVKKEMPYLHVPLTGSLNARLQDIFKQDYRSPRSPFTTLQLPTQGIGEWCHPLMSADIDVSGLYGQAKAPILHTPFGVSFAIPAGSASANNIAFASLWDNYPDSIVVPSHVRARHAYFLMAGTTNHMQSRLTNGLIIARYADGTCDTLKLVNPENWAPVEQDYYVDNKAFKIAGQRPYRVQLSSGVVSRDARHAFGINPQEVYGRSIRGGAGIITDMPLRSDKVLEHVTVKAVVNDVIIGLMGLTLIK